MKLSGVDGQGGIEVLERARNLLTSDHGDMRATSKMLFIVACNLVKHGGRFSIARSRSKMSRS